MSETFCELPILAITVFNRCTYCTSIKYPFSHSDVNVYLTRKQNTGPTLFRP